MFPKILIIITRLTVDMMDKLTYMVVLVQRPDLHSSLKTKLFMFSLIFYLSTKNSLIFYKESL